MGKIQEFKNLILKGKTLEEAQQESGVALATAKINYYLMKKNGELISQKLIKEEKEKEEEEIKYETE